MSQPLFEKTERERRFRIIERDIHGEFWKILKDSMAAYCAVRTREQLELAAAGKQEESERVAIEVLAVERIMADPQIIVQHNKPLFDGTIREQIKKVFEKKKETANV